MTGWSLLPTIDPVTHRPCHRTARPTRGPRSTSPPCPTDPAARVRALEQIVEQQAALLEREDEVHRVLVRIVLAGGALAELGDAVAGLLRGRRRRHHHRRPGARHRRRRRPRSSAPAPSTASTAPAASLVESEPVGPRDAEAPGSTRAFVKIVAGASDHGLLGAFSPERPLTAADVHLLERAATVAALAITKEQAVAAVEGKYRAEFLRDALAGRAGEPADAVSHAASLGWDIARPMVVVVAETDENDEETTRSADEVRSLQERFVRAWVQAVRARDTSVPGGGLQPGGRRPRPGRLRHRAGCRDAHRRRDRQGGAR